jgi:hypothetical protein
MRLEPLFARPDQRPRGLELRRRHDDGLGRAHRMLRSPAQGTEVVRSILPRHFLDLPRPQNTMRLRTCWRAPARSRVRSLAFGRLVGATVRFTSVGAGQTGDADETTMLIPNSNGTGIVRVRI